MMMRSIFRVLSLLFLVLFHEHAFVCSNTVNTLSDLHLIARPKPWAHAPQIFDLEPESLGAKLFSLFDTKLNPFFAQVAAKHGFLSESDVSISHYMIPMRDGVKLSTFVVQRRRNHDNPQQRRTAMLSRSPYGPTSDQMANVFLLSNDFVAVIQDQRGTFKSEGEYSMWHHDAEDGFDTLLWIENQPWSNGRVFSCGVSADAIGSVAMILSQPNQLKGQLVMWATMDGFNTVYPGGVFREGLITGWMTAMAPLTRGVSLKKTLRDILSHHTLSEWWSPIQGPGHFHQANWPTIHIAGWWDIFQGHQIDMFNQLSMLSTAHDHYLIVGPLGHCALNAMHPNQYLTMQEAKGIANGFGLATELFADSSVQNTFQRKLKKINVFVQRGGGAREEMKTFWSSFDTWPRIRPTFLLFSTNKRARLSTSLTAGENDDVNNNKLRQTRFSEFGFAPLFPVLTQGGNNLMLMLAGFGCGSMDQKKNEEARLDALVFTSSLLAGEMVLTGKVRAVVYISTKSKDTDVFVSLNDVYMDEDTHQEVSMQIRSGIQRLTFRESTSQETSQIPVKKDHVYKVDVDMWFSSYVVPKGHRLRAVISSSNAPYYAVNLDVGSAVSWNRIHYSEEFPSHIELPVVDGADLPKNEYF